MKKNLSKLFQVTSIFYLMFSLMIIIPFVKSEYLRFIYWQTLGHWTQKFFSPKYVFIGDSITAGGRNWGWRLEGNPLISQNFGGNGYTSSQIIYQAKKAVKLKPGHIFVLAGTNDIFQDIPQQKTIENYEKILKTIKHQSNTFLYCTLIPFQSNTIKQEEIKNLNQEINRICEQYDAVVININDVIAPQDILLPQYTVDGTHLTPQAYELWTQKIHVSIIN